MSRFWRTKNGLVRTRIALSRSVIGVRQDLAEILSNIRKRLGLDAVPPENSAALGLSENSNRQKAKPVIFASACVDEINTGGWKYNGGVKELNLLVKLLRAHGYEAYMVTYDGKYEPWLIEHQPHISITEFKKKLGQTNSSRCVTSWSLAKTFIDLSPSIYFWDMELAYSENAHFPILAKLYSKKIRRTAAISRTIQAWHMANFEKKCVVLPNIIDNSIWYPCGETRDHYLLGYMDEGDHTAQYIEIIKRETKSAGLDLKFQLIQGDEKEVLRVMRKCKIYLSLNIGKDKLWGEGSPRTIIEALAAGCVSVSFDIIGNREIITDNLNGIIVENERPEKMARAIVGLYNNPTKTADLLEQAKIFLKNTASLGKRFEVIKEFLEL